MAKVIVQIESRNDHRKMFSEKVVLETVDGMFEMYVLIF